MKFLRLAKRNKDDSAAAYARRIEPYLDGSPIAEDLTHFLLRHCHQVPRSDRYHIYTYGGLRGVITPRADKRGRVGFAFYSRDGNSAALFKRDRDKFPFSVLNKWIPYPTAYAHICGHNGDLRPSEFKLWSYRLLAAAKVLYTFTFPPLPDPDERSPESDAFWRETFGVKRKTGAVHRLPKRHERTIWSVWQVLVDLWKDSAQYSRDHLPKSVPAADTFLAERANKFGSYRESSPARYNSAIRRAILALDHAGYVVRDQVTSIDPKGRRRINCYLPGTGIRRDEPTRTRCAMGSNEREEYRWAYISEMVETPGGERPECVKKSEEIDLYRDFVRLQRAELQEPNLSKQQRNKLLAGQKKLRKMLAKRLEKEGETDSQEAAVRIVERARKREKIQTLNLRNRKTKSPKATVRIVERATKRKKSRTLNLRNRKTRQTGIKLKNARTHASH